VRPPAPAATDDLTFGPERPEEVAAVRQLVADAFGGPQVPDLLDAMRNDAMWRDLSHVARRGGRVVGHVAHTRAWLDTRERLLDVLVLSPLSVAPEVQGRGVGDALVRWSLDQLRATGEHPLVFLEGSPGYYARFGFTAGEQAGVRRPSWRIPAPAFPGLSLDGRPVPAGTLGYPEVFWRTDSVGLRDPDLAEVERALGLSSP